MSRATRKTAWVAFLLAFTATVFPLFAFGVVIGVTATKIMQAQTVFVLLGAVRVAASWVWAQRKWVVPFIAAAAISIWAWLWLPETGSATAPASYPIFTLQENGSTPNATASESISVSISVGGGAKSHDRCASIGIAAPSLKPGWEVEVLQEPYMHAGGDGVEIYRVYPGDLKLEAFAPNRGSDSLFVNVCWPDKYAALISKHGSTAIVTMPEFDSGDTPLGSPVTVSSDLETLSDDWVVDAGATPDAALSSPDLWSWKRVIPADASQTGPIDIQLTVHSIGEAQNEHSREFTSGALFGVAAATGVAGLQELLSTDRRAHK